MCDCDRLQVEFPVIASVAVLIVQVQLPNILFASIL